jgi:transcriptional regulator with GAF, ATPase, and Fis domain
MSPHRKLSNKRFYIGSQFDKAKERGIAGSVFMDGKAEICNYLDRKNGETDNPFFYKFKNIIGAGEAAPYRSFACVPIRWNNSIIGVLSIESMDIDAFRNESIIWLTPLADALGLVFFIYDTVKK